MSLVGDIFSELWNMTLYYKGIPVNILGVPKFLDYNYNSLRTTLSRLRQNGLITKKEEGWLLTTKGKDYYKNKYIFLQKFDSPFIINAPRNLLIMFDVPDEKRQHRDWLRRQLREYDYIMVQKSVWVGPSPLPKEFKDFVRFIKIEGCIKTFKLARGYVEKQM